MSLSRTPASSRARWRRSPRITCRWGTLRPFESLWMLGQKLAALNYVAPQVINRVVFNREYVGRKRRVTANLNTLAANLGCDAHMLEPFDPGHLLGIPDTQRLGIFRSSELRFCPVCLRLGFHSEIFQLRGLRSCPQHGCRLQTGCPGCQQWASIDEFLPALTCRCGHKLSEWTPQTDAVLAEKRFPKLEAFGHALQTHAAL
jgi:TniQ